MAAASSIELRAEGALPAEGPAKTLVAVLRAAAGKPTRIYERQYRFASPSGGPAAGPVVLAARAREDAGERQATDWRVTFGAEVSPHMKGLPKTWPCAAFNHNVTWVDACEPVADSADGPPPNNAAHALVALGLRPALSSARRGTVFHVDVEAVAAPLLDADEPGAVAAAKAKVPLPRAEVVVWDAADVPDAVAYININLRCGDDAYRRAGDALERMAERLERALRLPAPRPRFPREWLRPPDGSLMRNWTTKPAKR